MTTKQHVLQAFSTMMLNIRKATLPLLLIAALFNYVKLQPTGDVSEDQVNADRLSFLEWLLSMVIPGSSSTEGPEQAPIDSSKCQPCTCGLTKKKVRIVGGTETQVNQYPWMALLLYEGSFYCGGSLINSNYILTASHCVKGFDKDKIVVRLLDHRRSEFSETNLIQRSVQRVVTHSRYNDKTFDNDIALLRFEEAVPFEGPLRPVCLPVTGKSFTGLEGVVTGWGAMMHHGATSDVLNEVTVPIMSNKECRMTTYGQKRITDNMMCAGFPEGKKDSCQGDSGGPLHVINKTVHSVAGVVSWGDGCGLPDHPGVYTRVNRYITWIRQYTKDACYCE